jgi:uncharacterized protein (TIGR00251 family)
MELKVFVKIGRRYEILGWDGNELTVCINAPPIEGAANTKLIELISDWLLINKNKIVLSGGQISRHKTLSINIDKISFEDKLSEVPKLPTQTSLF